MNLVLAYLFLSVAAPGTLQPQALPPILLNIPEVFDPEDYPYWALEGREEGTVGVVVQVSEIGKVTGCLVRESSGSKVLDAATCSLIFERARFAPARDKNGNAVAGMYERPVRWVLPDMPPAPLNEALERIIMQVGSDGRVSHCRMEMEPPGEIDERTCKEFSRVTDQSLRMAPQSIDWQKMEIVSENAQFVGDGEAPMIIGKGPGEVTYTRSIVRVTVAPDGRVESCTVVERFPWENVVEVWCRKQLGRVAFLPGPDQRERKITFVSATYIRPKTKPENSAARP